MDTISIEMPKPEDAWGINNVLYQAWLEAYPNEQLRITKEDIETTYKPYFTDEKLRERQERLAHPLAHKKMLVAKDGNEVVGLTQLVLKDDVNQLQSMYILPTYYRRGIATRLWEEVKKFRDASKDTIVEVATYNQRAISFYEKLGFKDTGKRFTDEKFRMPNGAIIPEMEMILKA